MRLKDSCPKTTKHTLCNINLYLHFLVPKTLRETRNEAELPRPAWIRIRMKASLGLAPLASSPPLSSCIYRAAVYCREKFSCSKQQWVVSHRRVLQCPAVSVSRQHKRWHTFTCLWMHTELLILFYICNIHVLKLRIDWIMYHDCMTVIVWLLGPSNKNRFVTVFFFERKGGRDCFSGFSLVKLKKMVQVNVVTLSLETIKQAGRRALLFSSLLLSSIFTPKIKEVIT